MANSYSRRARRSVIATSPDEPVLMLVEISHEDLSIPVRLVSDTAPIVVLGDEFIAVPFRVKLPDDIDQQVPQAAIEVDNVGRELTQWLEYSRGGKGAKCRLMQVMRSQPDVIEFDVTLDLSGLSINNQIVSGTLGYQNTLMQPAVTVRFDPGTAPGLW